MYSITVHTVKMTSPSYTREQIRKKRRKEFSQKSSPDSFDGLLTYTVLPLSQQIPPQNAYFSNETATKFQHSLRRARKHFSSSSDIPPSLKMHTGERTTDGISWRTKKLHSCYNHSFSSRLEYLALLSLAFTISASN